MNLVNKYWKRVAVLDLFYLINFGLWELIAPIISGEWASFAVYVVLFTVVLLLFRNEIKDEWNEFRSEISREKSFKVWLVMALVIELTLSVAVIMLAAKWFPAIMPENNENVKNQMASVPVALTVFQGCILAPVIEEMTFRYGIIN